jgi:hypothetical protein
MPFNFRKTFKLFGLRFNVGRRGLTSIGVGPTTFSRKRTPQTTIRTGIPGLSFTIGGRSKRRRR